MADPAKPDLVEDLMRRLGDVAKPPSRAVRLVVYLVSARRRLAASYRYVAHSPEHVTVVLYRAASKSRRIAEADGRTGMVRELTEALLEASDQARREEAWAAIYAEDAKHDDDSFAEASALEAGSRWHPAA